MLQTLLAVSWQGVLSSLACLPWATQLMHGTPLSAVRDLMAWLISNSCPCGALQCLSPGTAASISGVPLQFSPSEFILH